MKHVYSIPATLIRNSDKTTYRVQLNIVTEKNPGSAEETITKRTVVPNAEIPDGDYLIQYVFKGMRHTTPMKMENGNVLLVA